MDILFHKCNKVTDMTNILSVTNTVTLTDNTTGLVQVYTFKVKKS